MPSSSLLRAPWRADTATASRAGRVKRTRETLGRYVHRGLEPELVSNPLNQVVERGTLLWPQHADGGNRHHLVVERNCAPGFDVV
jgi:hypothetical protein